MFELVRQLCYFSFSVTTDEAFFQFFRETRYFVENVTGFKTSGKNSNGTQSSWKNIYRLFGV